MKTITNILEGKFAVYGCVRSLVLALFIASAWAEDPQITRQEDAPPADWLHGDGITRNWGGLRTRLQDYGVDIFGSYASEVWGNTT